jgi:hypothetical protein
MPIDIGLGDIITGAASNIAGIVGAAIVGEESADIAQQDQRIEAEQQALFREGANRGLSQAGASFQNVRREQAPSTQAFQDIINDPFGERFGLTFTRGANRATESEEFKAASSFFQENLENPFASGLTTDFRASLRQAQAERGLFLGQAGAADEARRLAGLAAQVRQQSAAGLSGLSDLRLREETAGLAARLEASRGLSGQALQREQLRLSAIPGLSDFEVRRITGGTRGFFESRDLALTPQAARLAGQLQGAAAGTALIGTAGPGPGAFNFRQGSASDPSPVQQPAFQQTPEEIRTQNLNRFSDL